MTEGAAGGVEKETDFIPLLLHLALDLGQVGLALSLTVTLTGMFQWCVKQSAEVENMVMFIFPFLVFSSLLAVKWNKSNSNAK